MAKVQKNVMSKKKGKAVAGKKKPSLKKKKAANLKKKKPALLGSRRSFLRGAKSAWIFFCNRQRARVLNENPNLSFGDICKQLAPEWTAMSDSDKAPYIKLQKEDKERYRTQVAGLSKEQMKVVRREKRMKRELRRQKPKAALSAYMFFVIEERAAVKSTAPAADFQTIGRLLGERWQQMTDGQKKVYTDRSCKDKERYLSELRQYEASKAK